MDRHPSHHQPTLVRKDDFHFEYWKHIFMHIAWKLLLMLQVLLTMANKDSILVSKYAPNSKIYLYT